MVRSGRTNSPPLKPAIGVSSLSASNSIAMPRGGRPLVMAKRTPALCNALTAPCARSVSTFCSVTSVPSTSASTREILRFSAIDTSGSVQRPPGAAVACQQVVGRGRTTSARGIAREISRRIVCPGIKDGLHGSPSRFDIVSAVKQGRITDHAVVNERFVSGVGRQLEIGLVSKVHADRAQLHVRSGTLRRELECDALVGLDAQDHPVGIHPLHVCAAEERVRSLMKTNSDLGPPALHPLAGAQIERNAGPAPVVDLQLAGHERFNVGTPDNVGLIAIRLHRLAQEGAGTVLAAHGILQYAPWL